MSCKQNLQEILKGLHLEQEIICGRIRKIVTNLVDERDRLQAILKEMEQSIQSLTRENSRLKAKIDLLENVDSFMFFEGRFS